VNVVDENIIASQCDRLRGWRISFQQIGAEVGRKGMDDREEIIPLLHHLRDPTFFTRDDGFYDRALCHSGYCLVALSVPQDEAAHYIRRFLRHPAFSTRASRMGCVIRVSVVGIAFWRRDDHHEEMVPWPQGRNR
jgi:hypothetical protein